MLGPDILARTLSTPTATGKDKVAWQYHSRGDRHSKTACWGVLLDLMRHCPMLAEHARDGRVAFGINHEMTDFRQNRKKNLDLVVCTPAAVAKAGKKRTFADLVSRYGIELDARARDELGRLPALYEAPVGVVRIALEAKACMTAHVKALPRLYDELNSSHQTVHGSSEQVIAAGLVMVNTATEFVSPGRTGFCPNCGHHVAPVNLHKQPEDAARVVAKLAELPRRASVSDHGFDALAIVAVDCRNDGSPVKLVTTAPAPSPDAIFHYGQAVQRLAQLYESRFPRE